MWELVLRKNKVTNNWVKTQECVTTDLSISCYISQVYRKGRIEVRLVDVVVTANPPSIRP